MIIANAKTMVFSFVLDRFLKITSYEYLFGQA